MIERLLVEAHQALALAGSADELAFVVRERANKLAATIALVARPIAARAELGIVARGLVEPLALAVVVFAAGRLVPIRAVGAGVNQAESPWSEQIAFRVEVV